MRQSLRRRATMRGRRVKRRRTFGCTSSAARFGVRNARDPAQNVSAGTRYLKQLLGKFRGRVDLVLAGYNAGEGNVTRFGYRVPPFRETRNYVRRVSARYTKGE